MHKIKTSGEQSTAGFSVIELVVSLAVIVLVSAQVFVSFSGLGQGTALNRAAQELIGEIRKAQYGSLAVTYANVPISGVPQYVIPPAIGIQLATGTVSPQIIRFADRNDCGGCVQNNKYDASQGEQIGALTLPSGIKINRITGQNNTVSYAKVGILFRVPEATLTLWRDINGIITIIPGNHITIELVNAAGKTKTVTVRITGQINAN